MAETAGIFQGNKVTVTVEDNRFIVEVWKMELSMVLVQMKGLKCRIDDILNIITYDEHADLRSCMLTINYGRRIPVFEHYIPLSVRVAEASAEGKSSACNAEGLRLITRS